MAGCGVNFTVFPGLFFFFFIAWQVKMLSATSFHSVTEISVSVVVFWFLKSVISSHVKRIVYLQVL